MKILPYLRKKRTKSPRRRTQPAAGTPLFYSVALQNLRQKIPDVALACAEIEIEHVGLPVLFKGHADMVFIEEFGEAGLQVLVAEEVPQVGELFPAVFGHVVRDELHAAEDIVESGQQQFLIHRVGQIRIPQEEDVRIAGEGAAIEEATEHRVLHHVPGRWNLVVELERVRLRHRKVLAGIGPNAAGVKHAPAGAERHPAAEDEFVPAELPQEIHRLAHELPAGLPAPWLHADGVQKVQLDQIKLPFIEDFGEDLPKVIPHLRQIQIQPIGAAPAEMGQQQLTGSGIPEHPVRMGVRQLRFHLGTKRREPQARQVALLVDGICNRPQAVRKLRRIRLQPVPHVGLKPVIDLKHRRLVLHAVQPV